MVTHKVTARYEVELTFDVPDGVLDEPGVINWRVPFLDNDSIVKPKLVVSHYGNRTTSITGHLNGKVEAFEVCEFDGGLVFRRTFPKNECNADAPVLSHPHTQVCCASCHNGKCGGE
jgi:hypothetical protein